MLSGRLDCGAHRRRAKRLRSCGGRRSQCVVDRHLAAAAARKRGPAAATSRLSLHRPCQRYRSSDARCDSNSGGSRRGHHFSRCGRQLNLLGLSHLLRLHFRCQYWLSLQRGRLNSCSWRMRNSRLSLDYQRKRQFIWRRLSSDDVHRRGQRRRLKRRSVISDQRLGHSRLLRRLVLVLDRCHQRGLHFWRLQRCRSHDGRHCSGNSCSISRSRDTLVGSDCRLHNRSSSSSSRQTADTRLDGGGRHQVRGDINRMRSVGNRRLGHSRLLGSLVLSNGGVGNDGRGFHRHIPQCQWHIKERVH